MLMKCKICRQQAVVSLASHNAAFCKKCYGEFFRRQLMRGIESQKLFTATDKILVAVSGGKDSLVLLSELRQLGYNVAAIFIDLGIPGESAQARAHVERCCRIWGTPLRIFELAAVGLAIPVVREAVKRPICSVCGKIKRYYFNRLALEGGYDVLATGHNLDDEVSRLMSNTLRWDEDFLGSQGPYLSAAAGFAARVKPLWRLTEFEIANYAFLNGIDYHCAACPYSQGASFSVLKEWMHRLERKMPGRKLDFYHGFLARGRHAFRASSPKPDMRSCPQCGMPTTARGLCGICAIREVVENKAATLPRDCQGNS